MSFSFGPKGGGPAADPATVANTSDVADSTARLALTYGTGDGDVQIGDLVRQADTGVVYLLVGNTPSNAAHWQQMSALPASIIASGQVALARGGTGADLSATGGTGQVLKQSSVGGAITVGAIDLDSLSDVSCSGGTLDFGNTSTPVTVIHAGKGATHSSPGATGLRGTGGSGTNIAGGDLNLDAGPGTGNAATGTGRLRATSAGSSGSTLQSSWVNALTWGRSEVALGVSLRTASAGISLNYQGSLAPESGGYVRLSGSNGMYFNVASADRAYLTSSGLSIGRGGTAASAPIHVAGTSAQQIWEYSSGINASLTVDANGNLTIAQTGERIAIGKGAVTPADPGIAIGTSCSATSGIAMGYDCTSSAGGVALGFIASTSNGVAVGYSANALGNGVAIGQNTYATGYSTALNYGSTTTGDGQFVVGSNSVPVDTWWGGKGITNATPTAWGIRGTGGSGTNIAGGDLYLDAGPGTGNAATGTGRLRYANMGSSGTTPQATFYDALTWGRTSVNTYLPLVVESVSSQQVWQYSSGISATLTVDANGHITIAHTGNRISIGNTAAASADYTVGIGQQASAAGGYSIAIGLNAATNDVGSISIGHLAAASGQLSTAVGPQSSSSGGGTSLGFGASAGAYGLALGYGATAGAYEIALGSATQTKLGVMGTTPTGRGSAWSITNAAGARRTFDTSTVTLPQLAEVVATLLSHLGDYAGFGFLDTNY